MQPLKDQATAVWKKTTDGILGVGDHIADIIMAGVIFDGEGRALTAAYGMGYSYWPALLAQTFIRGGTFYLANSAMTPVRMS